ncbi:MAG: SRPBCC domain-containing protein [Fimbriimonadaceae bacterium]
MLDAMTQDDLLKPFILKIWIKRDAEAIQRFWTRSDDLVRWFLASAKYFDASGAEVSIAVPGGTYEWRWIEGTTDRSSVKAVEHGRIVLGWMHDKGEIELTFTQSSGETMVELKQTIETGSVEDRLSDQIGCQLGWTFFLANLKSVSEGGLDLREKDPARVPVLNY